MNTILYTIVLLIDKNGLSLNKMNMIIIFLNHQYIILYIIETSLSNFFLSIAQATATDLTSIKISLEISTQHPHSPGSAKNS